MNKERNKGITLIALVITIIIMLILAGVTLKQALGEHGLIKEAKGSINDYIESEEEEGNDLEKIRNEIAANRRKTTTNEIIFKGSDTPLEVTKEEESMKEHYGEIVTSFSSVEGVEWQLFYDDADNYYLIASDYVPISKLPSELYNEPGDEYIVCFAEYDDNGNLVGQVMDSQPWKNGSTASSLTSNLLTSKYLTWIGSSQNTVTANPNIKAVAFMMDTNKWSDFAGGVSGAKAMGGPTLEMFIKSYNAAPSHSSRKLSTYDDGISSTNANSNGYKVKWESNSSWEENRIYGLDKEGEIWVKTSTDKAYGMWLACPSAYNSGKMRYVTYDGDINCDNRYSLFGGFRPIVAIPK